MRRVTLVLGGFCSLRITVVYTAPAVPGYFAYRHVVTYTTRTVR